MAEQVQQVAPGVHRVADGLVNWYLVEDGGEVALIDAGWPRSMATIESALGRLGRSRADVTAIVLTHGHPDHLGAAEHARRAFGAPVYVNRDEVGRVKGKAKGASPFALVPSLLPTLWRPSAPRLRASRHGARLHDADVAEDGDRVRPWRPPRRARTPAGDRDPRPHRGARLLPARGAGRARERRCAGHARPPVARDRSG